MGIAISVNGGKTGKTCHQTVSTKSMEETSGQLYLQIEKTSPSGADFKFQQARYSPSNPPKQSIDPKNSRRFPERRPENPRIRPAPARPVTARGTGQAP
jgi:hypothetical protein